MEEKMNKKSIMIDMDEVIVIGNFSKYLIEFLGEVDFEKLNSQYRQDLIKGREEEFRKIYKYQNLYKNNNKDYVEPLPNCVEVIKELNEKTDKTKIKYDIGIDDRISNLESCDKRLLFTEFRNKKLTKEELENKGVIRINNWLDVRKELL